MKKSRKGFTLVELIVVIAIIGILAALLVPQLFKYIENAKVDTANNNAASVYRTATTVAGNMLAEGTPAATQVWTDTHASEDGFAKEIKDSLESSFANTKWAVNVDGGKVTGAFFAKTATDLYIGGYPAKATGKCGNDWSEFPETPSWTSAPNTDDNFGA